MPEFRMVAGYKSAGDQPAAITSLTEGIRARERYQTLLGNRPSDPPW